jgi:hypothetical protein
MLPPLHFCPIGAGKEARREGGPGPEESSWTVGDLQELEDDVKLLIENFAFEEGPCATLKELKGISKESTPYASWSISVVERKFRDDMRLGDALDKRLDKSKLALPGQAGVKVVIHAATEICKDLGTIAAYFKSIYFATGRPRPTASRFDDDSDDDGDSSLDGATAGFVKMLVKETGFETLDDVQDYVILTYPRFVIGNGYEAYVPMKTRFRSFERDMVKRVLMRCGRGLMHLSEKQRDDKDLVLAAVKDRGDALQWASDRLKRDADVVLAAVERWTGSKEFADPSILNDERVREGVLAAEEKERLRRTEKQREALKWMLVYAGHKGKEAKEAKSRRGINYWRRVERETRDMLARLGP